jgi:hypothetical protein
MPVDQAEPESWDLPNDNPPPSEELPTPSEANTQISKAAPCGYMLVPRFLRWTFFAFFVGMQTSRFAL